MTALVQTERPSRPSSRSARGASAPRDAAVVGLAGFLVAVAFSWLPSVWFDEAATVSGTMRSWSQLERMLGEVDAVHGVYYAAMHVWFDLVGYSPFTLRLPSAIAAGLTAALVVLLVRRLASRRTALLAGAFLCLLPRVTWMGTEGRSYALTAALAVALTLVFLAAWRSGAAARPVRLAWWALYGALAVLVTTVFLYLALLVVAHAATAAWAWWRDRGAASAASLRGWLLASVAAALALLPFVRIVIGQSGQVSWIDPIGWSTLHGVFVTQWFYKNPAFAAAAWLLIAAGIAVLTRRGRPEPAARRSPDLSLLSVALPWLVVPTVGLILASVLIAPLYSPRYLTYAAPAAAILMGVAVDALRRRRLIVAAVIAVGALAAPQIVQQRMPEAKQESSWSEVAALMSEQRAPGAAGTTEAIIYGPVRQHPAATTRVIAYSYPEAFDGLVDVKLRVPAAETGSLWETRYPLRRVTDRLTGMRVVWLVTSDKQDWRPGVTRDLAAFGFSPAAEWNLTGVNVLRYER